jgi:hypothetical protein
MQRVAAVIGGASLKQRPTQAPCTKALAPVSALVMILLLAAHVNLQPAGLPRDPNMPTLAVLEAAAITALSLAGNAFPVTGE